MMTYVRIAFKGHAFAKIKFHLPSTGPFVYSVEITLKFGTVFFRCNNMTEETVISKQSQAVG